MNELAAALERYRLAFPEESSTVARMLELLEIESCFERTHTERHFTASAWLVDSSCSRVLLTHHKKLNMWVQLGGHADGDSNLWDVAMREAKEESGLSDIGFISREIFDLDIHQIPIHAAVPAHEHFDCAFLMQSHSAHKTICSDESHELRWVHCCDIAKYSSEPRLHRMARKLPFRERSAYC